MLKINAQKTELIHFSSRFSPSSVPASVIVDGHDVCETSKARNLGVVMDQHLILRDHVQIKCCAAMSALKRVAQLRTFLSPKTTEILIHAFVSSRIDSCNGLLFGVSQRDLCKLQVVQNSAARLIMRANRRDPVTPMLTCLHWLPVEKRIIYKIIILCHKILINNTPTYLVDLLQPYKPLRSLRSEKKNLLIVPKTQTQSYGDRAFSVVAPRLWNELPQKLRDITNTDCFMKALKTHLFV